MKSWEKNFATMQWSAPACMKKQRKQIRTCKVRFKKILNHKNENINIEYSAIFLSNLIVVFKEVFKLYSCGKLYTRYIIETGKHLSYIFSEHRMVVSDAFDTILILFYTLLL